MMKAALISSAMPPVSLLLAGVLLISPLHSTPTPAQNSAPTNQNLDSTQPDQTPDSSQDRQFYAIASKSQLTLRRADGKHIVLNRCSGEAVINQRLGFLGIYYIALELECQSDGHTAKEHDTIHIAAANIMKLAAQPRVFKLPRHIELMGEARLNGVDKAIPIVLDVRSSKHKSKQNTKDYTWNLRAPLQDPASPDTKPSKLTATLLLTELK